MCITVSKTGVVVSALASLLLLGFPETGQAQVDRACYIPEVGAVYRIREVGLPDRCVDPLHVEFSWPALDHDHIGTNLQGFTVDPSDPEDGDLMIWFSYPGAWIPEPLGQLLQFYQREAEVEVPGKSSSGEVGAPCDAGDQVVSGGYSGGFVPNASYPGRQTWFVAVYNGYSEPRTLHVYAICVHL